jgi:phosphatidylserine/phosphatidylglycerophosphate/cardiolipin synthase-like enzyme
MTKRSAFFWLIIVYFCTGSLWGAEKKEPIANYSVLFSPKDHLAEELIALISKEKKSIKAAVFCLMHRGIGNALIEAHQRGVNVEIIIDPFSIRLRSVVKKIAAANIPIFIWNPPTLLKANGEKQKRRKPLMHDKFCVLGDQSVWTGSFNFTFEADTRNRENVVILENRSIAKLYLEEFERLKEEGCMSYQEYTFLVQ